MRETQQLYCILPLHNADVCYKNGRGVVGLNIDRCIIAYIIQYTVNCIVAKKSLAWPVWWKNKPGWR